MVLGTIGLLAAVIAAVFGARTVTRSALALQTLRAGLLAEGQVLDTYLVPGDQGRPGVRHAIVAFHTPDRREFRIVGRARAVGDRVPVRYRPERPDHAVLGDVPRSGVGLAVLVTCSITLLLTGF